MERERFETIARALAFAPSRREATKLLAAGLLATAGWDHAAGKRRRKKKKKKCKPPCGECQTCSKGKCKPIADGTRCAGGVCEDGRCDTSCTPDCKGEVCGANDGCGGICETGSCFDGASCVDGFCVICIPDCEGIACGADNGCGGTCQTGICPEGAVCEGQCVCIDFACCQNSDCEPNEVCVAVEDEKFCVAR